MTDPRARTVPDVLRVLARSFRATLEEGRRAVLCGPFVAYLSDESDDYLLNVAVPVEESADWAGAIPALDALFARERRRLRLEFFRELAPALGPALTTAGVALDMKAPVMALTVRGLSDGPRAGRLLAAGDTDGLAAMELVQAAAYGDMLTPEAQAAFRPILRDGLSAGRVSLVLVEIDGEPAAAAMLMIGTEAAELAGVATAPHRRGRGLAEAACRSLLDAYFAAGGALAWLSAAPDALKLYERLGFESVGTQLNMGRKRD